MPTLAALLDLELPDRPYDGIDIMPILQGERQERGKPIAFYFRDAVALSADRYKLIASEQTSGKRAGGAVDFTGKKFELYDLTNDPGETTDLADQYPDIVDSMKAELRRWVDSVEASRIGEDYGSVSAAQLPRSRQMRSRQPPRLPLVQQPSRERRRICSCCPASPT